MGDYGSDMIPFTIRFQFYSKNGKGLLLEKVW